MVETGTLLLIIVYILQYANLDPILILNRKPIYRLNHNKIARAWRKPCYEGKACRLILTVLIGTTNLFETCPTDKTSLKLVHTPQFIFF